ncbi:MAG: hypothetical protein ACOY3U_05095 [Bacillota bacterium]
MYPVTAPDAKPMEYPTAAPAAAPLNPFETVAAPPKTLPTAAPVIAFFEASLRACSFALFNIDDPLPTCLEISLFNVVLLFLTPFDHF